MNKYLNKRVMFALLSAVLSFLIAPSASSVGIGSGPLPKMYFFEPNMELTFNMRCFEYTDDCEPYVIGALSEYASITDIVQTGPKEKSFNVRIKLPERIESPGLHEIYVGATDIENRVSTGIAVITKVRKAIRFMVLYGEKYAEFSFSAPNINENETATFTFEASNFGKPDLMLVYGKVDIYSNEGKKAGSTKSKSASIMPTETKTLSAEWDSYGSRSGQYLAVGTLHYDGQEKTANQTFLIGAKDIGILNYTREFEAGKISRMDVSIKNRWNGPINELYGAVKIEGMEFKTPSISLNAFQDGIITGYLDAGKLEPGKHSIGIDVYFDGSLKKEEGEITVYKPKERGLYLPMNMGLNMTTVLVLLVVLLILFNIIIFMHMRKKSHS